MTDRLAPEAKNFLGTSAEIRVAYDAIDETRRVVMDLYGGNLDHPALDHLETAMVTLLDVENERRAVPSPEPSGDTK